MSGVTIVLDTAGPLLARVQTAAQRAGLVMVGANAVAFLVKEHLFGLNAERHRYGNNYYSQAAESVVSRATASGAAVVSVTQRGFRQRLFGGPIAPKAGRKYLTIPAQPEAHAKRAREFEDLDFDIVLDENGVLRPALVQRASTALRITRRKRKDGTVSVTIKPGELQGGRVMFWLVRRVNQRADPSVLPAGPLMREFALEAMRRRLLRLDARAQEGTN